MLSSRGFGIVFSLVKSSYLVLVSFSCYKGIIRRAHWLVIVRYLIWFWSYLSQIIIWSVVFIVWVVVFEYLAGCFILFMGFSQKIINHSFINDNSIRNWSLRFLQNCLILLHFLLQWINQREVLHYAFSADWCRYWVVSVMNPLRCESSIFLIGYISLNWRLHQPVSYCSELRFFSYLDCSRKLLIPLSSWMSDKWIWVILPDDRWTNICLIIRRR